MRQGAEEKIQILFQGKKVHPTLRIPSGQGRTTQHLQMMELQSGYAHGAHRFQGGQHILLTFSGDAKNQMGAEGKTARCQDPLCGAREISKAMMAVEKLQAPFVNTLQPQLKQAILATCCYQISKWPEQGFRDKIGAGRNDQANAIGIGQESGKDWQQFTGRHSRRGLLLKIGKVFGKSPLQKMHLSFSYLQGNSIAAPQVRRSKTLRPAIDTTATQAVGTRQTEIQGDFADSLTKFLPTMIAKGAENRWGFST